MKEYLAKLTSDLVKFKSIDTPRTRGELIKIVNFIEQKLKKLPNVYIKKLKLDGKPAMVVTFKPNNKKPKIFLNGHLDVVEGNTEQFKPYLKNNKLYGRGTDDMKGGCAVMIALIEHFARQDKKPDVGFMFVTDEEEFGNESKTLQEMGYKPELLIVMEATELKIVTETKGVMWIKGKIKGKPGHGSTPWATENCIETFHESLKKFYKLFPPLRKDKWKSTYAITGISSGDRYNKIPESLTFKIDIRYLPKETPKNIIKKIKSCFPKYTKFEIAKCDAPHTKAKNMRLIKKLGESIKKSHLPVIYAKKPYATDGRFFAAKGIDTVIFGPSGQNMHGDNEWVDIDSLKNTFTVIKNFLEAC